MKSATRKANDALRKIEAARKALEKEQRRLAKHGTSAARKQVKKLLDQLDETEVTLLSAREEYKQTVKRPRRKQSSTETVAIERELLIRGFWDRYPSSDQRGKYRAKYDHIEPTLRKGPTAYDVLLKDYQTFSPAERKRLLLRVDYGVVYQTGEIITPLTVKKLLLEVSLSSHPQEAMDSLSTLLVRAGLLYAPEGYTNITEETGVPLGVQWVILPKRESDQRRMWM